MICASRRSASTAFVVAVRRPHHRREVRDQQRLDDRVELRDVLLADVSSTRSRVDRDVAGRHRVLGADPAHASIFSRPCSTAHRISRDGWKRPTRCRRFSISPRNST